MLVNPELLDLIRFITGFIILSYASYTDIKIRKAENYLWLIMGGVGVALILIQYFLSDGFNTQLNYLIFIPIMIGLMYLFFQLRLLFGGADAKALMALAILMPIYPSFEGLPLFKSLMPFSWIVFTNSVILFLFIPLSLLVINIVNRNFSFPHCFLGYKMSIKKAKEKFVWPLERIVDGKLKFSYIPYSFDSNEDYEEFEKIGIKDIWVTPKVPFMIPMLAGFICAFYLGDILFAIMELFI
jgi:preflagellin peptidase FlaK